MAEYKINKDSNEIIFEGVTFKLDEVKLLLKKQNAELYSAITCPGEIKFTLSREAKIILRQLKESNNAES